jgi:hypothetical protein
MQGYAQETEKHEAAGLGFEVSLRHQRQVHYSPQAPISVHLGTNRGQESRSI